MNGIFAQRYYYKWFALVSLLTNIVLLIGVVSYETYVGTVTNGASSGLTFGALMLPADMTAERFVRQQRRIPTRSERWHLAIGSLFKSHSFPCRAALPASVLVYFLGITSPSAYWMVILFVWHQSKIATVLNDADAWMIFGAAMVFVFRKSYLFLLHRVYGSMADKMLTAVQKREASRIAPTAALTG